MRQSFEAREAEKTAGALDGVNEAENVIENFRVIRILLEFHQLNVDEIETFVGLGEEFAKKIIHEILAPETRTRATNAAFDSLASLWAKPLFLVELTST